MTDEFQRPTMMSESLIVPPLPLPVPDGVAAIVVRLGVGARTLTFRRVHGRSFVDIYDDVADLNVRHTLSSLAVGLDTGIPSGDPQIQLEVIARTFAFGYEQRGVVDNLVEARYQQEHRLVPRDPEPETPDLDSGKALENQELTGAGTLNPVMASRSEEALEAARAEIEGDE